MEQNNNEANNTAPAKAESFKPDYRIVILSLAGFAGLIAGFLFMAYPEFKNPRPFSNFHEIIYDPRKIAREAFGPINKSVGERIQKERDSIILLAGEKERAAAFKKTFVEDSTTFANLHTFQRTYIDTSPGDTSAFNKLNELLHFDIEQGTITRWDNLYATQGDQWEQSAPYWMNLPGAKPDSIYRGSTTLSIRKFSSDMQFAEKYPGVGTWVLLILIFCSFCFVTIATCIYTNEQTVKFFNDRKILTGPSRWAFYLTWALTLAAFLVLSYIWENSFNDEILIKALFMMKTFMCSMKMVTTTGYIAGACCLAGFIQTASMLGYFAEDIRNKNFKIAAERANLVNNPDENAEKDIGEVEKQHAIAYEIYTGLQGFFNRYFIFSAIILSLMVLCVGGLYSTTNGLDFVRLLANDWGFSPARTDYIYLYGALHTIILLLVYIPAKMRFSEIRVTPPATGGTTPATGTTPPQAPDKKWFDIFKNPFSQLKEILLAASPLLASLVNSLLDLLFK